LTAAASDRPAAAHVAAEGCLPGQRVEQLPATLVLGPEVAQAAPADVLGTVKTQATAGADNGGGRRRTANANRSQGAGHGRLPRWQSPGRCARRPCCYSARTKRPDT